jgi:hypothetical protein
LYRVRSLEDDTPPNSNILFPVVFENEASITLRFVLNSRSILRNKFTCSISKCKSNIIINVTKYISMPGYFPNLGFETEICVVHTLTF